MIDKNTIDKYNKHLSKKDSEYRAKRKANVGMYLGMAKEFAPKSLGSADELVASKIKQKQKSSDWWNTSPNERKARGYGKGGEIPSNIIEAVNKSNNLMQVGTNLDEMGVEYKFNTYDMPMPPAMYKIKFGDKHIYILNKNYVDGADYVKDEIGVGIMAKGGTLDVPNLNDGDNIMDYGRGGEVDIMLTDDDLGYYSILHKGEFIEKDFKSKKEAENWARENNYTYAKGGIIVRTKNASRDDIEQLENYLENESWEVKKEKDDGSYMPKMIISTENVSKDEIKQLENYLENESWDWKNPYAKGGSIKDMLNDNNVSFADFYNYLQDKGEGDWDSINSEDIVRMYIDDMNSQGVDVEHIEEAIEENPSSEELYGINLGNSMNTPYPINNKQDLYDALELDYYAKGGKIEVGNVMANTKTKTIGIVRDVDLLGGDVRTDADGVVDADNLEHYSKSKHKEYQIAPSTKKEIGSKFAKGGEIEYYDDGEPKLDMMEKANMLKPLEDYGYYLEIGNIIHYYDNNKNWETSKIGYAKGGEIASAIFNSNSKKGKISTSFGDKTKEGLTAMIENDSYSAKEIANAIFEFNEKRDKVETNYGDKTKEGLIAMIESARESYAKGGKTKKIKRSGKWGKNYSELCSELATYKSGGGLWIETDKEPPVNEGAFVSEAEKRNMSVKELMNKALKYPTKEDFNSDAEYDSYKDSKKGKKEIKLRSQAQMVKNMGNYAKGGNVVDGISQEFYGMNIAEIDGEGIDDVRKLKAIIFELNNRLEEEKGISPFDSEAMREALQGFDEDGNPYGIDNLPFAKGGIIKSHNENHLMRVLIGQGMMAKSIYDENKPYFNEKDKESLRKIYDRLESSKFDYAKGGMIDYSKEGFVKAIRDINGKIVKEVVVDGVKYRRNSTYKTYNSIKDNQLLHKSKYAKGGKTSEYEVKKVVNGNNGSWTLEEYQDLPNKDWMGKEPLSLERTIEKVFELNDEAIDYEDEIRSAEDVNDLGDILYENNLVEGFNTYNNSWWGGVRQYYILKNWDDKLDLDYETIVFLSFHRGGDVRGNYEKYEAFELDAYGYEDFPLYSDRLSYIISKGDKSATFDTEDDEGYSLYTIEDDFGKFEVDDSTDIDKVSEEFNVSLY